MNEKFAKVKIYYFSGTGNAKNTAFWIGEEALKEGIDTEIIDIAKIQNKPIAEPNENSLIGFISPTHGFHFPEIMRKFIRRFPQVKNCSAFVANTRAGLRLGKITTPGLSGLLHYWASAMLYLKGFKIIGLKAVDLPSNWLSIHPALRKKEIETIYQYTEPKVRRFAKKVITGKKSYRALFDVIQDMVISPLAILYIFFGKYFFAKTFIASSNCNMCGLCKKACPVHAIKELDNRMFWTSKCESCMKCMNSCPKKAIETAHGFIIVSSIVLTSLASYLCNLFLSLAFFSDLQFLQNESLKSLLISIIFFPLLFLAYRIMHELMRFKLFERIFVLSSLTKYKFWGRYKAPNKRAKTHHSKLQKG